MAYHGETSINQVNEETPLLDTETTISTNGPEVGQVDDAIRELKSTTAESIANILNLLMGMGILSLPFAFSKLGWVLSLSLLLTFSVAALFTGTLISEIVTTYTSIKSMYEMVDAAFQLKGRIVFGLVFMLELFAASIAMIILFADSIIMLFPQLQDYKTNLMVGAVVMLTPLTFLDSFKRLTVLSYVGLMSILFLIFTMLMLGVSNLESSLIDNPISTMWPQDYSQVGLGIGLLFVGFDGHSVFPSLNIQMKHPNRFPVSLSLAYLAVFLIYLMVGAIGYAIFGEGVIPEITSNIIATGFSPGLVNLTLLLFAFNPLSKYSLLVKPINSTLESISGVSTPKRIIISRIVVNATILAFACLFPAFHKVMAFIGAALSFTIVTITPTACYLKLIGSDPFKKIICWSVLLIGTFLMIFSTIGVIITRD